MKKTKVHHLKTWIEYFEEIFMDRKKFEVRKNDRDYKVGDFLIIKEFDNDKQKYTGREMARVITYVLHGGQFGIEKDYVVLSIG